MHRAKTRFLATLGLLAALTLLAVPMSGCGDDPPPAKSPAKGAKSAKGAKGAKGPKEAEKKAVEKVEEGEYKRPDFPNQGRRDPFVFVQPKRKPQGIDEPERVREPLENFALGSLSLTAIITNTPVPKAMFKASDGFGYIAKEGDRIGRDGGRISDIRPNEVEVTINAGSVGGTGEILDDDGDRGSRDPVEPVKVVILLSNTDIALPSDDDEEDPEDAIIDGLTDDGTGDGAGGTP